MEKIKNFVVKYQLWFKIGAIVIIICTVFVPFVHYGLSSANQFDVSIWDYVLNLNVISPDYRYLSILSCIIFSFSIINLILLLVNCFVKKYLLTNSIVYTINFLFMVALYISYACITINTIPHVGFFLALILFIFNCFVLYNLVKHQKESRSSSDSERIAELEKKVTELENKTAAPEQRELHPKDKDGE